MRKHGLFGPGDRLIIGLSGGADSVALTHLLPDVARAFDAAVVGLAHLNHQLRPSAGEDEAFCRELAGEVGLPIDIDRVDVASAARRARTSLEDAARVERYRFLRVAAVRADATRVAVAHTRNDQAETVLLRLLRGAGPGGLAGILPRVDVVIRPLLDVTRAEVEAYLAAAHAPFREDPTNRDVSIPRNWVRHDVLPAMAERCGAGIVDVLARHAALAREDAAWIEDLATETTRSLVLEEDGRITIERRPLLDLPVALARRVVRAAAQRAAGGRFVGFDHVETILDLARNTQPSQVVDLPGQRVRSDGTWLVFIHTVPDAGRDGRRRGRPHMSEIAPPGVTAKTNPAPATK